MMGTWTRQYPTLTTERLLLRPFADADVEPLHALMQDPDVMRYVGDRRVPTRQETWRAVAGWIGHWALRGYGLWAVVEQESGDVIGRAGIINPVDWPGPEVGYLLGKRWWGRGYATEAAAAAMAWGFSDHRLRSAHQPDRPGQRRFHTRSPSAWARPSRARPTCGATGS